MIRGARQYGWGASGVVAGVVVVLVGVFGIVVLGGVRAVDDSSVREGLKLIQDGGIGLFARSFGIAGLIGVIATGLGALVARGLMGFGSGSSRKWVWGVALVPIWMPSYALYGAMNLARAPDTMVGGWLISYATSEPSHRWAAVWAGYAIGVLGLGVWGSVIAAMVIAGGARERAIYRDMMDLEPAGWMTRARVWVGVHRGVLVRAWGVVTVVMMGSGVPLHLAQLQTWSIMVWRGLIERQVDEWGTVWVMGLPMVVAGLGGAWLVTRVVVRDAMSRGMVGTGVEDSSGRGGFFGMAMVWGLAVVVPVAVLMVSIDDWRSMGLFWTERGDAIWHSVVIGGVVGLIGCGFAMGIAGLLGHWARWVRWVGVAGVYVSASGALVPGVLVGASVVQAGGLIGGLFGGGIGGWFGVYGEIAGLLVRVLVVGGIVGAVVAGRESGELVSQRWSLGGGVLDWWRAHGKTGIAACVGAGVLCGLLAVHEIEASVMITRAGVSTLSQSLLADLHYARLERLSAALLNLMGAAMVVAAIGGVLVGRGNRKNIGH
tara:strand:- start:22635 stop:24266 length:1632 start_codon:yes stop_codon:yes gene_type:complete